MEENFKEPIAWPHATHDNFIIWQADQVYTIGNCVLEGYQHSSELIFTVGQVFRRGFLERNTSAADGKLQSLERQS